jgi:hypothetical protein
MEDHNKMLRYGHTNEHLPINKEILLVPHLRRSLIY